jgi:hypothetical protein
VVTADKSTGDGFSTGVHSGAVVSLSVGNGTIFRVLTHGCQIEQWRVQTAQRLLNALAIYLIVAWRIHHITLAGRAYPEVSCEVVFEPQEWSTLYPMPHHGYPPPTPPPLREMVRSLAPLGGFFAR